MTSDRVNTGAKAFLKSLAIAEEGKERELIRFVVTYTGWLLLLFVWVIYLLSPELRAREAWIYRWLSAYLAYQIVVTTLGRVMKKFYETLRIRMARIQVMLFLASALVLLTDGAESYFWFVYLLPLLASALYFSWPVTWRIYGEVAVLYFLSSLVAVGGFASINFALLLSNLAILLVLTAVLRYLMESIRQHQAAKRALRYSELLQQVQQDVDAAINLQEVLNKILQRAVNLVGARDGALMLMEGDGRLHFHARVRGLFPVGKEERTFTPGAPDEGIAGWVARNRKPYICRDTKTDTQFVDIIAGGIPIRSLVSVPIISHDTVLGVINVDSPELDRFSGTDADLLVALADQVAVAIERAELLQSLREIGEKTLGGAEDPHQRIVDAVHRFIRCPVAMRRVDEAGKQARIVASRGVRPEYIEEAVVDLERRSVTGKAIRKREIVPVLDIQADPDFQNKEAAAREGWQSYLAVPLLAGPERAVGTLSIYSTIKREKFTRWELDLLRTFAGQAGVVIRNADLVKELVVLNEIGQAVSVLGVEAIANLVYQRTSQLMDTTNFFLCLYDKEKSKVDYRTWIYNGQPLEPFSRELSGLISWIIREEKSLLIRDWDEEEHDFPVKADIITERQRSWLGVPLLIGGEVLGVMSVQSPHPNAFDLDTQRTLEIIANQAAVTIENARLLEESQNRLKLLNALHETSHGIVQQLNLGDLMPAIIERAANLMAGEHHKGIGAAYWRCDHETQRAIIEYSANPTLVGVELGFDEGLVGEVIRTGRAKLVNDYPEWPLRAAIFNREDLAGLIKNIVEVPVKEDERVVAILAVSDASGQRLFGDADAELLELFATQAAIAIQNARLHADLERHIERLQTLNQVSRELSAKLDKESIFETVVKAIVRTLNCTHCTFFVLENNSLVPCASHTKGKEAKVTRRFALGEGLAGWVAQTGKAILARDAKKLKRFSKGKTRPEVDRSMIVVPVKVDDQVVGVISVDQDRLNAFSEEDQHLAEALAAQAAVAFLTAELFAEAQAGLQERVDDIRALQDIYALMGTAPLNDMLQQIAEHAARLTPAKHAEVWLLDQRARELRFGAENRIEGETTQSLRMLSLSEPSINTRVALTKETYLCNDVEGDPYYGARYRDTRSELTIPLMHGEKVIGTLNLESTEVGAFTDDHVRLVEALAGAVTVAIQNARLYEKIRALNEVGRVLTSGIRLREAEVLELIHSQASKLMNTDNMYIALYDEATDTVRFGLAFVDGRRVDVDNGKDWQSRKAGKGRTEWIIDNRRPILISTKAEAEAWYKQPGREEQVGGDFEPSWLGVPMMVGEKVLGVIATYHPTWSYMFGRDDLEVLQAMASEAAIALDNAKQVQLRIEAERRAYVADLAQTTAHHLKNELGSIRPMAEIMIEDADLDLPADYRKSLEMICTNASSAERLIARLFAPFRDLSLGQIGVDWLIIEARNSVSPLLSGIGVVDSCAESLPAVYVDRLGTVGVFAELLTNAQEAIKRGSGPGRIDVIASLSKDQDWVEVQFANNGPPIPPQLQEVLFEPRKGIETSGFGLGLWSARVLLEREGGSIHLLKSDEEGTRFLVRLPVSQQEL